MHQLLRKKENYKEKMRVSIYRGLTKLLPKQLLFPTVIKNYVKGREYEFF